MADTIDTVCRGRSPLKGAGMEVFHFAVGRMTLCNREWYEAGWLKMDTDVDVEALKVRAWTGWPVFDGRDGAL